MTAAVAFVRDRVRADAAAAAVVRAARSPGCAPICSRRSASTRDRRSLFVALGALAAAAAVAWATVNAVWSAPDGALCRAASGRRLLGVHRRTSSTISATAPIPRRERWRVDVVEAIGARADRLAAVAARAAPRFGALLFFVVYPVVGFVLLHGAPALGLPHGRHAAVGRRVRLARRPRWSASSFSLPLGVLLALGRRSRLPVVRLASVIFIEFVRGVPFITVLFMANNMLPLFLPPGWSPTASCARWSASRCSRPPIMAEEVRGGLQTLTAGQYEGAMALGLDYWRHDAARRAAAGAGAGHPGHRQQFHRPVQGYDAGGDRRHQRFPRRDGQCLQGPGVERADDAGDRLRLRRRCSISSSAMRCRAIRRRSSGGWRWGGGRSERATDRATTARDADHRIHRRAQVVRRVPCAARRSI